jgi:predicted dehydrogenase
MVGGGPGAFIGPVHRMAAALDGRFRLVAGAFSRDAAKSAETGEATGARAYDDYAAMIAAEQARDDGAEAVVIVTPNRTHLPIARAALSAGLHVISDKPATATLAEARELAQAVRASGCVYALTYTYTGYPMVREARSLVARGDLGPVRKVVVEYAQGWLSQPLERSGNQQAEWRADPWAAGAGGAIGDIGVHAFNLAEFVSGARVQRLCADLGSVVPGRALDDDCNCLLRLEGGARGVLIASQISAGGRNGLRISVYGERGGLHWSHERLTELVLDWPDRPTQVLHAGSPYLSAEAQRATRLPGGHPEGFIEAFANIYADFADAVVGTRSPLLPGVEEGLRGMAFVERAVGGNGQGWVELGV